MTKLQIDNQSVSIDKGELVSYKVDGHEFIHQKGSPGWGSSDTEMFPIIGPVNETGFQVQVPKGNAIQDQHGLLRQMEYLTVSSAETEAHFRKVYKAGTPVKNSKYPEKSPKQWLIWPYSFIFEKRFVLTEQGLEISFSISGEKDMPYMLGFHPAFKLHAENSSIQAKGQQITLEEVLEVGNRALQIEDCVEVTLQDKKDIKIKTEGFGHFMCWTLVRNMVCIEPITFYPYSVSQRKLHEGFEFLEGEPKIFKVKLLV